MVADVYDPNADLEIADDYLTKWDRFAAFGDEDIDPPLSKRTPEFEAALTRLLLHRDPRSVARLVFYTVVQIAGSVDIQSELGRAAIPIVGNNFEIVNNEDGTNVLFAPKLYFWWQDKKDRFPSFPLFDEWHTREFAQSFVIPMYHNIDYGDS